MLKIRIKGIKAQSALEFLTTYGWAFLILLVMIAALAYFGILNPSKVLPNACTFGSEFTCVDYQLVGGVSSTFRLKMKSNDAAIINITNISLSSEGATSFACTTPNPSGALGAFVNGTSPFDVFFTGCNAAVAGFNSGNKAKVFVKVRYYDVTSGLNYLKEVNGEVFTTVI